MTDLNSAAWSNLRMALGLLQRHVGAINRTKGWREDFDLVQNLVATNRERKEQLERHLIGAQLELVHEEVAEAFRELRKGHGVAEIYYTHTPGCALTDWELYRDETDYATGRGKPDCSCTPEPKGFPVEVADAIIRLVDHSEMWGYDLGRALQEKVAFNTTREYKHGGKTL